MPTLARDFHSPQSPKPGSWPVPELNDSWRAATLYKLFEELDLDNLDTEAAQRRVRVANYVAIAQDWHVLTYLLIGEIL